MAGLGWWRSGGGAGVEALWWWRWGGIRLGAIAKPMLRMRHAMEGVEKNRAEREGDAGRVAGGKATSDETAGGERDLSAGPM